MRCIFSRTNCTRSDFGGNGQCYRPITSVGFYLIYILDKSEVNGTCQISFLSIKTLGNVACSQYNIGNTSVLVAYNGWYASATMSDSFTSEKTVDIYIYKLV